MSLEIWNKKLNRDNIMKLQKRKATRLKGYNYSTPGAYFITLCVKDRKPLLSEIIVGTGIRSLQIH